MTLSRRALSGGLLALAVVPAGCSSPTPTLYTLDAVPGSVLSGGPHVVILQDVGLAPYLDRKPIVRSTSDYHIEIETNKWWGETLSAMIG
ncbi:MAG TPA: ABC-type transport auxiliary lipoprotein family protein, partial [Acidisoma sp.]|nr:ABC-type transport auxiliary lipoprotein family protein [Acidisoma sp.]